MKTEHNPAYSVSNILPFPNNPTAATPEEAEDNPAYGVSLNPTAGAPEETEDNPAYGVSLNLPSNPAPEETEDNPAYGVSLSPTCLATMSTPHNTTATDEEAVYELIPM